MEKADKDNTLLPTSSSSSSSSSCQEVSLTILSGQ
jgi:hypothetical protein